MALLSLSMPFDLCWLVLASVAAAVVQSKAFVSHFNYTAPFFAPYALITMGTPAQRVSCVFDIGSSDTLIQRYGDMHNISYLDRFNPSTLVRTDPRYGYLARVSTNSLYAYNASQSESVQYNETSKQFIWNQYQTTQGLWATERFFFKGDQNDSSVQATFGLVSSSNTTSCVIGLGPVNGEISGETFENHAVFPSYENALEMMLENNVISTRSFSIWFNKSEHVGAVVFGGTDTLKYLGNLTTVPIVSYVSSGNQVSHIPGTVLSTRIMFHGLSVFYDSETSPNSGSGTPELAETLSATQSISPEAIDLEVSGAAPSNNSSKIAAQQQNSPALQMTTSITVDLSTLELFTRLPRQMVDQAAKMLGLTYIEQLGMYGGSCQSQGSLRLNMSSFYTDMDLADVFVSAADVNVTGWKMSDGSPLCFLTILPEDSYSYVMGNGILQNLYIFVDLSLETVSFAPLNLSAAPNDVSIRPYEYNDRYSMMNTAPGYNCTSLSRAVSATFFSTSAATNGTASVVVNAADVIRTPLWSLSAVVYLFLCLV